jgi:hypothetical protein
MLNYYLISGFVNNYHKLKPVVNDLKDAQGVRRIISSVVEIQEHCMGGFCVNIVVIADDEKWKRYSDPCLEEIVDLSIKEVYAEECFEL